MRGADGLNIQYDGNGDVASINGFRHL
jgi:hypothetical protein